MARGERTSWQALSTWCCSPATSSSFSNHERTGSPPPHSRTRRDCPSGECRLRRHVGDRTALASIAARCVPGVGSRRLFGSASAAPRALQHPPAPIIGGLLFAVLLGVTIACHGFPDASGRTGRVLYAICQCMLSEDNGFNRLKPEAETLLTGLVRPVKDYRHPRESEAPEHRRGLR